MEAVREKNVIEIPITKEMKQRQKELSDIYRENLDKYVWKGDKHMTDFCVKGVEWFVELPNGMIIPIEKHRIRKDFCFGYSLSRYDSESFDNAQDMAHHAKESIDYFIKENMEGYDKIEDEILGKNRWQYSLCIPFLRIEYTGMPRDCIVRSLSFATVSLYNYKEYMNKRGLVETDEGYLDYILNDIEKQIIADGLKIAKQLHYKKVMAYVKRYGTSKVNTWTYWQDA